MEEWKATVRETKKVTGWTPESVVKAVAEDDMSLLREIKRGGNPLQILKRLSVFIVSLPLVFVDLARWTITGEMGNLAERYMDWADL